MSKIKPRQIQTSLMPDEVRRLIKLGHEHGWKGFKKVSMGGSIRKIVRLVLRLRRHEKVDAYLKRKDSTLFTLIETAVLEHVKRY